jgi:rRNA small subunit pseudouridine methyltransferase Nep1
VNRKIPLTIILVDCGIELIPKEIRDTPAVKNNISRQIYSSQLLDNSLHHTVMKNLKNADKRGRPDITHLCLLNALGSSANKSGELRLFLHTTHNRIFKINPEIRIARNYNRFKGLMAKLLIDGSINVNNTPLISEVQGELENLINKFINRDVIILSSKGELVKDFNQLFSGNTTNEKIVIIGGFQKGNFSNKILGLSKNLYSISNFPLDAWVVVSKIINFYELTHNIV